MAKKQYTLTINSKTKSDLDAVIDEMKKKHLMPTILKMDECFGPFQDDSFISLFSGLYQTAADDWNYIKAMNFLAQKFPTQKFTLKIKDGKDLDIKRWNFTMPRCRVTDHD